MNKDFFQIVINTSLLREVSKSKILNYYAHFYYIDEKDLTDRNVIKDNILNLFDWDANGDSGLAVFCSKFESIKRYDLDDIIQFIIDNAEEIKLKSKENHKLRTLEQKKLILTSDQLSEQRKIDHFCDENYEVNPYGKPAKVTIYEGRVYKSRQECMYKEGITKNQLYQYLKKHEKSQNN